MMRKKWSWKKKLAIVGVLVLLLGLVHIISMLTIDKTIEYKDVTIMSEKIPDNLQGYRITFVSDTHHMNREQLQAVVDRINDDATDLLLLGGDYGWRKNGQMHMEVLAGVQATDGIYGVEGNHDNYEAIFAAMKEYGIVPLDNSGEQIRAGLYVGGTEDLWNRKPDVGKSVQGASPDDFVLLVSHNPDVAMEQDMSVVDLTVSGHVHGGHITFLGIFAPAAPFVTKYGQRFVSGMCQNEAGDLVYLSNGTGYYAPIPRVFARPQVITFVLQAS